MRKDTEIFLFHGETIRPASFLWSNLPSINLFCLHFLSPYFIGRLWGICPLKIFAECNFSFCFNYCNQFAPQINHEAINYLHLNLTRTYILIVRVLRAPEAYFQLLTFPSSKSQKKIILLQLQALRKHINGCFERIDGFLLPHPGLDTLCFYFLSPFVRRIFSTSSVHSSNFLGTLNKGP